MAMVPMQVREEKQRNKHKIQNKRNAYIMTKNTDQFGLDSFKLKKYTKECEEIGTNK